MNQKSKVLYINLELIEAIEFLNEKFKDRSENYQSKINNMLSKIAILENKEFIEYFRYFFEINYIEMYSDIYHQDIGGNPEYYTIIEKEKSYFMYKILLIYNEMDVVKKVNFRILKRNKHSYVFYEYINEILNILKFDNKLAQISIEKLDKIASKINFLNYVHTQGKAKSPSSVLLGVRKNKSFRTSILNDRVSYNVLGIKKDYVKRLVCPVCEARESIHINNLERMFKSNKTGVEYRCKHEKNESLYSKKVMFNIDPYIKEINSRKINKIDFVLWNWKFLCSEIVVND